jgi:hypothetical protein
VPVTHQIPAFRASSRALSSEGASKCLGDASRHRLIDAVTGSERAALPRAAEPLKCSTNLSLDEGVVVAGNQFAAEQTPRKLGCVDRILAHGGESIRASSTHSISCRTVTS